MKKGAVKNYLKVPQTWIPGLGENEFRIETYPLSEKNEKRTDNVLVLVRYLPR